MANIQITVQEISEMLGISKYKSYKIVHQLNDELIAKGFIVTSPGCTNRKYFSSKIFGYTCPDKNTANETNYEQPSLFNEKDEKNE